MQRSPKEDVMVQYPKATWKPLQGHSSAGTLAQRTEVILHITDGDSEVGAFNQFQASTGKGASSAHFCIEQDGTVYQYVDLNDSAWHASQVNGHSVGIEHVAMTQRAADYYNSLDNGNRVEMPATAAQVKASAELVSWLCKLLNIPPDRAHVREHCEASPADQHPWCCHAELDPNAVVTAARQIFQSSTSTNQRILFALGPGTPWLRVSQINDRVKLYPGDFVPSVEAVLRDLNRTGDVTLMESHGRIIEAQRSR
ncbi:MAG TPA: peptidoglycan recognition family protein [Bryobacteraceae bacterium]|nr:peptidoglycan recognition family protein [Bryobacteraceae bacterium]